MNTHGQAGRFGGVTRWVFGPLGTSRSRLGSVDCSAALHVFSASDNDP